MRLLRALLDLFAPERQMQSVHFQGVDDDGDLCWLEARFPLADDYAQWAFHSSPAIRAAHAICACSEARAAAASSGLTVGWPS